MDMENLKIIGVIGGVGPYAGLDFVKKIFANTRAVTDQEHLDCMLVSCSSIVNDRTAFLLENKSEEENPAFGMFESARRLHMAGVRVASVACNTAHAGRIFGPFKDKVKESLPGFEIVNMLESSALFVKEAMPINKLGLLATLGTHKSKVYHEYYNEAEGLHLIEPEEDEQEKVHDAIYNTDYGIKATSDQVSEWARGQISDIIDRLIDRGAQGIILGCTELPLAISPDDVSVPLIDPGLIAARRLISLTAPEKLLPY